MTVSLRPATVDDMTEVGELHHRSRVAAYSDFLSPEGLHAIPPAAMVAWWTERFPYETESHRMTLAVDADSGRLLGFSYVGPDEDLASVAQLYAIHLEPDAQGSGVGRALMVDALAAMARAGWRRAVLWVLEENAHARRFYERGGWRDDGTRRDGAIGSEMTRQMRYGYQLGASA